MTSTPSPPLDQGGSTTGRSPEVAHLVRHHLLVGWGGLSVFIVLGVVLEGLHAFKTPLFLDADQETRRMLFRLAHAHGTLLSIVHWGAAWTFSWALSRTAFDYVRLASRSLTAALLLLPGGFFLGGLGAMDGDPGVGIVLVPAGALSLLTAVVLTFALVRRAKTE